MSLAADAAAMAEGPLAEVLKSLGAGELPNLQEVEAIAEKAAAGVKDMTEQPQVCAKPGMESVLAQFQAAVTAGNIDLRGSVGQRFTNQLKVDSRLRSDYEKESGTGSTARRAAMRMRWATEVIEGMVTVTKTKQEMLEEEYGEEGRLMAFDKVCVAEGGLENVLAVQRATHYVAECLKRGFPFIQWHAWKRSVEFLYFEKTYRNIFRASIAMARVEKSEMTTQEAAAQRSARETPQESQQPRLPLQAPSRTTTKAGSWSLGPDQEDKQGAQPAKKQRRGGKQAVSASPAAKEGDGGGEDKKSMGKLVKDCKALKNLYGKVTSAQQRLEKQIKEDDCFAWANNEVLLGRFESCKQALETAMDKGKKNSCFVWQSMRSLRQELGTDFQARAEAFLQIRQAVKDMDREQQRFNEMHKANLNFSK